MHWEEAYRNLKTDENEGAITPKYGLIRALAPADADERRAAGRRDEKEKNAGLARAWYTSQVFLDIVERESGRQMELEQELREVEDRDFFDNLGEGWKAGSMVIGGAVALASIAAAKTWPPVARGMAAGGVGVLATIAASTTGKKRTRKEAKRIKEGIADSKRTVRRAGREVGMIARMMGPSMGAG